MSEYDNTNSGVIWRPHPDQQFTGQGKLNIDGADYKVAVIKEPLTKGGDPEYNVYVRIGPLFKNTRTENEKAPNFSGPIDHIAVGKRMAAWAREKDGRHYMSLAVSDKQDGGGTTLSGTQDKPDDIDDEIPF